MILAERKNQKKTRKLNLEKNNSNIRQMTPASRNEKGPRDDSSLRKKNSRNHQIIPASEQNP